MYEVACSNKIDCEMYVPRSINTSVRSHVESYRNPMFQYNSYRIHGDGNRSNHLSDPIVSFNTSKRILSSVAKTTSRKNCKIEQSLTDLAEEIHCDSVTRNSVGLCQIIGFYKI